MAPLPESWQVRKPSQSILALVSHNLTVDFGGGNQQQQQNGFVNNGAVLDNGAPVSQDAQGNEAWEWNRITVDFGDHSYVACLSNRRIHVVKRDNIVGAPSDGDIVGDGGDVGGEA
ncbi:Ragulator complex protein LAMTOR4 [Orchesella cincta]|uniref:Ragulator complex protein LAMTOR4 n=1 Tax=Orchesella cincta TaxID=48709 RepID=A0A1D2MEA5_ORCCI|nr:Ragulator complex protein LAMTOR4 [Orchesella cincta]